MENVNQNYEINQSAKVLPFRVTAVRIPLAELEKILDQLNIASFHMNGDWSLDWEDRNEACRAICDAISALVLAKRQAEEVAK